MFSMNTSSPTWNGSFPYPRMGVFSKQVKCLLSEIEGVTLSILIAFEFSTALMVTGVEGNPFKGV